MPEQGVPVPPKVKTDIPEVPAVTPSPEGEDEEEVVSFTVGDEVSVPSTVASVDDEKETVEIRLPGDAVVEVGEEEVKGPLVTLPQDDVVREPEQEGEEEVDIEKLFAEPENTPEEEKENITPENPEARKTEQTPVEGDLKEGDPVSYVTGGGKEVRGRVVKVEDERVEIEGDDGSVVVDHPSRFKRESVQTPLTSGDDELDALIDEVARGRSLKEVVKTLLAD